MSQADTRLRYSHQKVIYLKPAYR